jgi:hypothetical protein
MNGLYVEYYISYNEKQHIKNCIINRINKYERYVILLSCLYPGTLRSGKCYVCSSTCIHVFYAHAYLCLALYGLLCGCTEVRFAPALVLLMSKYSRYVRPVAIYVHSALLVATADMIIPGFHLYGLSLITLAAVCRISPRTILFRMYSTRTVR